MQINKTPKTHRMFNNGLRNTKTTIPEMRNRYVALLTIEAERERNPHNRWVVTVNIDGWPHSFIMWGEYEMDIFKQVQEVFKKQGAVVVEPPQT